MAVYKIFGPPGTGKTTCLLGHMEKALEEGTPVTSIGFFSFTNKAADEAKERAMAKFPWLDSEGFCYFRTLHSLALQRIGGFRANPCMTHKDWVEFGRLLGITFSFTSMKWDDDMAWAGATDGDKMRSLCDLARLKRQPLKKVWQNSELDTINFFEVERFEKWSRQYKKDHQLIDFCDMLERACLVPEKLPSFDLLFIDEAQDLSTLQWDFAKLLIQKAKNTYVAGDDDQAIFCWAGADVQSFISLDGENRVLNKSYRVPRSVHALADKLRKPIKESVEKVWQAREEEGLVKYHYELDPYKIGLDNGDWLILTRNNYQLEPIVNICMEEGFSFWTKGSFLKPTSLKAIVAWEDLRRGKDVAVGDICLIYDLFGSGVGVVHGAKKKLSEASGTLTITDLQKNYGLLTIKIWHEAFDRMATNEKEYYLKCRKRGEKLLATPRIRISTIHGAKGGEANKVLLLTDMSHKTMEAYEQNPSDEHRVWYVGCTRAKQELHILLPQGKSYFPPLS